MQRNSCIAYIGIGSNMGDRLQFCRQAVLALASPETAITKVSSLYETDPVEYTNQAKFYNAVVEVRTQHDPFRLLKHCQEIERQCGKNITIPKGPRTLDLDILFYQDQIIHHPELTLPHPSALKRHFVLIPLIEIAPDFNPPLPSPLPQGAKGYKVYGPEWIGLSTQEYSGSP